MSETIKNQKVKELLAMASAATAAAEGTMDVYDGLLVSYPTMTMKHPEAVIRPLLNQMHVTPHAYHMDNPLGPLVMLKAVNTVLDIADKHGDRPNNDIEVFMLNTDCDANRLDDTVVQVIYDDFRVLSTYADRELSVFFLTREAPSVHGITPQVVLLVKVYPSRTYIINGGSIADAEGYRRMKQVREGTCGTMFPLPPHIPILQWNFTLKINYIEALIKDLTVKAKTENVAIAIKTVDSLHGGNTILGGLESSKVDGMKVNFLTDYARHNDEFGYTAFIMALPDYVVVNGDGVTMYEDLNVVLESINKTDDN